MRNNSWLFVQKVGTLLVDRRFWVYLLSLGIMLGVVPATADKEALSTQTVDAILLVAQSATAVLGILVLVYSWTKRPPSGLDYKKLPTEVEKVLPVLIDLLSKKDS